MSETASVIVSVAFCVGVFAFTIGHIVGYWRGKNRVTCPLCEGRGFVPAKGPTINNEKEVFDAGFQAGLREGLPGVKEADHDAQ